MICASCQLAVTKFEIKISKQIGHRKDKPTSKHQDKWSEILLNKPLFFSHFPALHNYNRCEKFFIFLPQVSRSSIRSLSRVDSTFDGFMCQIMYKWILNKREYLGPVWPAADDIPFCSIFTYFQYSLIHDLAHIVCMHVKSNSSTKTTATCYLVHSEVELIDILDKIS